MRSHHHRQLSTLSAANIRLRTGMRGSHPGAYEVAHALGRDGATFPEPAEAKEHYDLVVVGAGISGLAAAYFYRQKIDPDAKYYY